MQSETTMQSEIKHSWFYPQSPEQVWEYLTNAELLSQWLMPNNFEPVVGHDFQFRTTPILSLSLDGIFQCKVLAIDPCKKLTYRWQAGPGNGAITLDTVVEWSLESKENGTALHLVHSGFKKENSDIFTGMYNGWLKNIDKMSEHLTANHHDNVTA
jgi:uncharacterized protein YndB with AHSA1/START domain